MTIERRIRITTIALVLYAAALVLILFWSSHQVGLGIKAIETTSQVDRSAFMLRVLMSDYLDKGSSRVLAQWQELNARLGRILSDEQFSESVDPTLLEQVRKNYQSVNLLYPRLTEMRASTGTAERSQDGAALQMLKDLMLLQLEQLVHAANDLNSDTQAVTLKKRTFVRNLIVVLGGLAVIIILVNIHLIRRAVVSPLQRLAGSAERVGEGNFDRIPETKSDDEVGRLTAAFNTMIEGLRKRTAELKNAQGELELRIEERTAAYKTARAQNELLQAVHRAQTEFMSHGSPEQVFDNLLQELLVLTKSEFGFIDEVPHAEDGKPYLRIRSITDISWDEESRKMYRKFLDEKALDFFDIRGLWGAVVRTGEPVISNDPAHDPRAFGTPEGHPPLQSFLGLPLFSGGEVIGLIGVANRGGGYTQDLADFLQPYVATAAAVIDGYRAENRRREAEEELREAKENLENRVTERTAELQQANLSLQREITVRRRAEGEVLRAKEEWERTFDAITDPVMVLDTRHAIVKANKAMTDNLGISPQSVVGLHCFSAVHGSDKPPHLCPHARLLEDGLPHSEEIYEERLGATFHVSVSPLHAPDGSLLGSVHYMRDITERKRAEEAVKAERQRLYGVLETLPVYVCLLDSDYRMPFANRYFRETFGESHGRRCHDFLFNKDAPCEICETYTVMRTGEPHHWYWTGPNGRDYDIYDFPFTDADGSLLILEMGIDITERNKAEEGLKQTLADLARSNADLEQFAYVASHDLQEPLRNVASCMQLLEKGYKDRLGEDADQLMRYAVESVVRMKALIQDLLAYSRVATRGKPAQLTDCEIVLENTLSNLTSAVEETGAVITHDPLPTVMADSTQLMQVFQNVIGNALKFRSDQPPQIHISAVRDDQEWIFSAKDNGIGIESRHLDRIFVIFQRLHKRAEYDGTGMGLAIVKKIVDRHRGRVWVESEPGQGTTFYFTIPVKET